MREKGPKYMETTVIPGCFQRPPGGKGNVLRGGMSVIRVLGVAGSLRKSSFNRSLLRAAGELCPPEMTLETFALDPIPLYNADVEAAGMPEPVRDFRARIAAADAMLLVTPEYNHSIPGVLKNAIDWASR